MYRHCTFCAGDLGANEVLENFPVGRRLAFDAAKGRLWVICRQCERWNLTPLEERWEAVEDAERIFRATRLRVSTEQVGLARHREGLELVRIGAPLRPEFAAWRYGDQFGRRRKRFAVKAAVGVGVGGAVVGAGVVGGAAVGAFTLVGAPVLANAAVHAVQLGLLIRRVITPRIRVPLEGGELLEIHPDNVPVAQVRPGPGPGGKVPEGAGHAPWHLQVVADRENRVLTGPDAVRTLRAILPKVNASGARPREVGEAVRELDEVGGPEPYFADVELRARRVGMGYRPLMGLPTPLRLALEMAAHEDAERVALEGELAWLETAWREAEEVAAIADSLALPDRVRLLFAELRRRRGRTRESRAPV